MLRNEIQIETYQSLVDDELAVGIERVTEYWAGKSLRHVAEEMPEPTVVPIADMQDVALVQIEPSKDYDESRDIVLAEPYLNGYTPHHYIRAKTLQLLAAPNHNLWLLPNIVNHKPAYSFNYEQKSRLAGGSMSPIGEVLYTAFDELNRKRRLGAVSLTGYSQGAHTALAIAGVNQTSFSIERVNADEAPSFNDRTATQLQKDFLKPSNVSDLRRAVKDADIKSLSQAMSAPRLSMDLMRFAVRSRSHDAKLLQTAMTGSATELVRRALRNGAAIKLGYVVGGSMFDPASIDYARYGLDIIRYEGKPFNRKRATGDNVLAHALMAAQGLRR